MNDGLYFSGSFWLRYGMLKMDYTMIIVNVVGVSFMAGYCLYFLCHSLPKKTFACQLFIVFLAVSGMIVWVAIKPSLNYLGIVCMTFNIINFGAPLAGLAVMAESRRSSVDFLGRPPSYKSRSSSVPDISSLQSF
uniref:Sugar transporter SWEET1 n=1 Tax=Caenorhabditis japonica TaxID=281687 RepID=A0A8R1EH78_CAEJA